MAKLWKSDWVETRSEPHVVGSIQRVAKNGRWADVKWRMEGKEWSKRMLTKFLLLKVEIPQPGGMTVNDQCREDSLANHSGENFSFCDQPCHHTCRYEAPCRCCQINPWRNGMFDRRRTMFNPSGPGPHRIRMLPPTESLMASLARVLGMTEGNLRTALGVDLSRARSQTMLTMLEIAGADDLQQSVIIPSPLYDFLYAEIATGFPPVVSENLALRIAKCLESVGAPLPFSCLRVHPIYGMAVMICITLDVLPDDDQLRIIETLMRHPVTFPIRAIEDHRDPFDGIEDAAESDNAIAEIIELVKQGNRELFDEMAQVIGIPMEHLHDVWDGIKKRTKK